MPTYFGNEILPKCLMRYTLKVRQNILPLSVGSTLPEAFEEWSFTDVTEDHESAEEVCQLCDKEGLRYHFLIKNVLTGAHLWVGSHCILQFDLSVYSIYALSRNRGSRQGKSTAQSGKSTIFTDPRDARIDNYRKLSMPL